MPRYPRHTIKLRSAERDELVRQYRKLARRERRMEKLLRQVGVLIVREEKRRKAEELPVIRF